MKKINGHSFARKWMGKVVEVSAVVQTFRCPTRRHTRRELPKPIVGWVIGYRYLRTGTGDCYEFNFTSTGPSVLTILVSMWPGATPMHAAPDAIALTDRQPSPIGSLSWGEDPLMRELAKRWPRDGRGRFLKIDYKQQAELEKEAAEAERQERGIRTGHNLLEVTP